MISLACQRYAAAIARLGWEPLSVRELISQLALPHPPHCGTDVETVRHGVLDLTEPPFNQVQITAIPDQPAPWQRTKAKYVCESSGEMFATMKQIADAESVTLKSARYTFEKHGGRVGKRKYKKFDHIAA